MRDNTITVTIKIRDAEDGTVSSRVSIPTGADGFFERYEPRGAERIADAIIYCFLGLGHGIPSIREALTIAVSNSIYEHTGKEEG